MYTTINNIVLYLLKPFFAFFFLIVFYLNWYQCIFVAAASPNILCKEPHTNISKDVTADTDSNWTTLHYNNNTTKQKKNTQKKMAYTIRCCGSFVLLSNKTSKVFLRGLHLTPLSTYLSLCVIPFVLICLVCCLLQLSLFVCSCVLSRIAHVSYASCYVVIFCFFDAESKQNCISTPINSKYFLSLCVVWSIEKKKISKKKNEKKKR